MNATRIYRAGLLGMVLMGLLYVAITITGREPVTRRETWCPTPEIRSIEVIIPATEPSHVLVRLREIRRKAADLAPPGLDLDSPPAPGTHAELDALIRDLIADLDSPATPEEPNP